MHLKRSVIAACVTAALLFAVGVLVVNRLDVRSLAADLAASVKANTGRELDYGTVGLSLLPRPAVEISELRLANVTGAAQPWMLQIGRISADFDLAALLTGHIKIVSITVSDSTVLLETDPDGIGNWVMSKQETTPGWLSKLEIDEFQVDKLTLTFRDGVTNTAKSVQIDQAHIEATSARQPLQLEIQTKINDKPFKVGGTIGSLSTLMANAATYPVNLDAQIGATRLSAHGTIDRPQQMETLHLTLIAETTETADLAALFGVAVTPMGPLRASGQLEGSLAAPKLAAIDLAVGGGDTPLIKVSGDIADIRAMSGFDVKVDAAANKSWHNGGNRSASPPLTMPPFHLSASLRDIPQGYRVDDLALTVAGSDVVASLQILRTGSRFRVTGKASAPLIDLARMSPPTGSSVRPAGTGELSKATNLWQLADADLQLSFGRLVLNDGRELQAGSGRFELESGRLKSTALEVTFGGAKVKLAGSVVEPHALAGLDLKVAVQGQELAELSKFFGRSIAPVGPYQAQARIGGSFSALNISGLDASAGRAAQNVRVRGQIDDANNRRGVQLALNAKLTDTVAAGRLFGIDLPRLPAAKVSTKFSVLDRNYVFDDVQLVLGRTSVSGRISLLPGEPRPRVNASLSGALVDLSELPFSTDARGGSSPLPAADIDADLKFDRVVLGKGQVLNAVNGNLRLMAGAIELKQFGAAVVGASITLDGTIKDPVALAGIDLKFGASLTRGNGLAALTGMPMDGLPPFTANGKLTDVPDGYAFTNFTVASKAATVTGSGTLISGPKRYKISINANSPMLDVATLMGPATKSARVIPDMPLPIDALQVIDADIDLHFGSVKFDDAPPMGALLVSAVIADGQFAAKPVQLVVDPGKTLNIGITADATKASWTMRADGTGIDLGKLLTHLGHPGVISGGPSDLKVQLDGRGKSLAALLGSLNGDARISVGPHRIFNFAVNPQASLVLRAISPTNAAPDTDVKCLAAHVPIRNGVVNSVRNVAIETAKYNAVLAGQVNLASESIDASVVPVVTSGFGIGDVTTVIKLRGNVFKPEVEISTVDVAVKSIASIGAAVFTLGGSLVADALFNKVRSDSTPCATALAP